METALKCQEEEEEAVSDWLYFMQRKGQRALFLEDSTRGLSLQPPDIPSWGTAKGNEAPGVI